MIGSSRSTCGDAGRLTIPARFLRVKYNGAAHPQAKVGGLRAGANCQRFAFELLWNFGCEIGPMRSSELWADRIFTRRVRHPRPFDLLMFSRDASAWGAHVVVYLGEGRTIHLSKALGRPGIWDVSEFAKYDRYKVLIGIKRPIRKTN